MPNFNLPDSIFKQAAAQFPTPFFLYDEAGIRAAIRELKQAFAWAPHFMEYFAVKALPNPRILQIFVEEGFGLDCASECELLMAERVQAQGRIMFSANNVPDGEFAYANRLGAILNLDDITDIDQVLRECGQMPKTISMRLNPGGGFMSNNAIIGTPEESKYGWTIAQMQEGLPRLKALGVKKFGIHALLASNAQENGYYPALAELLMQTAYDLADKSGVAPGFVNLSGGIGIPYRPGEPGPNIPLIGADVEKAYRRVFGAPAPENVSICTELGRHMTGPHGWLVTHAIHHKDIYRKYIGVDGCTGQLPRPAIYGAYHHVSVVDKRDMPHTEVYDVVGSLCENSDKFAVQRPLPPIETGDLLLVHDAGAHCYAMSHNYNGRLRCAEIMLHENGSFQMIRRAETAEDYFATLL